MAKKETRNSNKWIQTFKGVGKELGKAGIVTLQSMAPGVNGAVTSTASAMRDSRAFISKTGNQMTSQMKSIMRNYNGRKASSILNEAFTDIKNGTFTINKTAESSYDSIDDLESLIGKYDSEINNAEDPNQASLVESKKNTAILGKVVAQGNAATIEGLEYMTNTMSNVNMKIADASTMKLANISLMGINQMNVGIIGINNRLDAINTNIISIMNFHRNNTSNMHQQMMEYNSQSLQMMNEIGTGMAEIRDFMKAQREYMEKQREITKSIPYEEKNNFSDGFDFDSYREIIKKNFGKSDIGMYTSFGKTMLSMASMGVMAGQSPLTLALSGIMEKVMPKSLSKSIGRFDKTFSNSINNILYRIGDYSDSDNMILKSIGQIFGIKKEKFSGPKLNNFKKDAMSWNGLAQQTLVEVIPNYLARIESKITGQEARFYNMETGTFQGEDVIKARFRQKFTDNIDYNMMNFRSKFKSAVKDDEYRNEMANMINDMIYNEILDGHGSKGKTRQDLIRSIDNVLRSGSKKIDENTIRDILMEATSGIDKAISDISDTMKNINSVERNIFNDETRGHHTKDYQNNLYQRGNVFKKRYFGADGKSWDSMTDKEREAESKTKRYKKFMESQDDWDDIYYEDPDFLNEFTENMKSRFGGRFSQKFKNAGKKVNSNIDKISNIMYDYSAGIHNHGGNRPSFSNMHSSNTSSNSNNITQMGSKITSNINKAASKMADSNNGLDNVLTQSKTQITTNSKNTSRLIHDTLSNKGNSPAIINNTNELALRMTENENSLKSMVLSLNDNFLSPIVGGLFGKDNFFKKIFESDRMKKLRDILFDENNGPLGGVNVWFKEKIGEISHAFTGKGYVKKDGTWVPEKKDSVLDYISNGYDFLYSNTMKYIFGDDYRDNKTFQKYFKWADWKSKRKDKRNARITKHEEDENRKKVQSNVTHNTMNVINGLPMNNTSDILALPDKSSAYISQEPSYTDIIDIDGAVISEEIVEEKTTALAVIRNATEQAAEKITSTGTALSTMVLGNEDLDKNKIESDQKKLNDSFLNKIKKFLPLGVAGAIGGSILGTSVGLHGSGLIGSLFLPGGPISGAILGVGLTMLAKSDKFQKFMFGEKDDDGKRNGVMISQKTQDAFKKSLPLIVGASTIGAIKGLFKSSIGASTVGGPGGFLMNSLLPGGPIGGAMLGLGIALLKNNEGFKKILWGEKNENGEKTNGILTKASSSVSRFMQKGGNFIKGGIKGALIGAGSGLTIGQMGLIGSALSVGGPIGMGLAGLGIGIASQTQRFQDLLFGTKEFDKDGNFKGRRGDGLLLKVRNMLVVNVLDPVKDALQENVNSFAYWLKDNITYPFRLAFGPILDSMSQIKKDVHDTFENLAKKIGDHIKRIVDITFKPVTKIMGFVGKSIAAVTKYSAKVALAPVSVPLKMMQLATSRMRRKAMGEERSTLFNNIGTIARGVVDKTRQDWDNDDRDYGNGVGGTINRFMTHGADLFRNAKGGYRAAKDAYEAEMREQGYNHFGWRGIRNEKKQDKINKKKLAKDKKAWKKIDSIRRDLIKENDYGEAYYSEEGLQSIRSRLVGADKRFKGLINSNKDLNDLLYNRSEFKDKLSGKEKKDKRTVEEILRDGIKTEPGKAQDKYQQGVLSKFDLITKEFTKFAARDALAKKKNIDVEDLSSMNDRLKSMGLTWKDVGVNPSELVKMSSISNEDWDKYMKDKFGDEAKIKDDKTGFKDLIENILEGVNSIKRTNEENLNINESDLAAENHLSRDDIKKARNGNTTYADSKNKRNAENAERAAREKDESLKAQSGHLDLTDESENEGAIIDGVNGNQNTKKTVFDSIGGFVKGVFGTLGSFIINPSFWKFIGIGTLVMSLFSDKIMAFSKKFIDFLKPYGEKALNLIGDFLTEKIPKFLGVVGDFIQKRIPEIAEKIADGVMNNIDSFCFTLTKSIELIGKNIINAIAYKINPNLIPFEDAYDKKSIKNINKIIDVSTKVTGGPLLWFKKKIYKKASGKLTNLFTSDGNNLLSYGPGAKFSSSSIGYGDVSLQSDPRWANFQIGRFPNGQVSTMATGGCGPTALAMVAKGMGSSSVNPLGVANYAKQNGYIQDGGATADLFTNGARSMGLTASKLNKSNIKNALATGKPIILSGKSSMNGPYTEAGHVIEANGLDSQGRAIVNDPMRGRTHVGINKLVNGMTHGWSYSNSIGYGNVSDVNSLLHPNGTYNSAKSIIDTNPTGIYGPIYNTNRSVKSTYNGGGHKFGSKNYSILSNLLLNEPYMNAINNGTMKALDLQIPKDSKSWMFEPWSIASGRVQPEIQSIMKYGTLTSQNQFESKLKQGYTKSNDEYKFNTKDFYKGLKVADIKALAIYEPSLLVDTDIGGFKKVYDYFVNSGRYKLSQSLMDSEIEGILGRSDFIKSLGGNGKYQNYEYKYGFPFFQTDDPRWANIQWRGGTIASRGGDISSLASVATAFSPNVITPEYINNEWLNKVPVWMMNNNELNLDRVFSNDGVGFNSFNETKVDGKKLKIQKLSNTSTIITKLKQNIPVVLTGYRYKGGPFGGYYPLSSARTSGPDDYSTVVARAANDTHMAILDPFTTLSQKGIFDTNLLNDKINGKSVIKTAYMVADPDGRGIKGKVDLSKKKGGVSDYQSIADAKGLDKITALFSNILAVGSHILDGVVSGDGYRSITSINEIENGGLDEAGLEAVQNLQSSDIENPENNAIIEGMSSDYARGFADEKDSRKSDTTYWLVIRNNEIKSFTNIKTNKKAKVYTSLTPSDKTIINLASKFLGKGDDSSIMIDSDIGSHAPTNNGTYYYVNRKFIFKNLILRFDKATNRSKINNNSSRTGISTTHISESGKSHGGNGHMIGSSYNGGGHNITNKTSRFFNKTGNIAKGLLKGASVATTGVTRGVPGLISSSIGSAIKSKINKTFFGYGNGNRDLPIGYGVDDTWSNLKLSDKLNVIASANTNAFFGKDYNEAKNEAIMALSNNDTDSESSVSTESINDTSVTVNSNGKEVPVPNGFPKALSYMGWQLITSKTSNQYKLREAAGMNFDKDGLGIIRINGEDRYTVAVKPAYGKPGDLININYKDGTILKAIVADQKGTENNRPGQSYYEYSNFVHSDGSVVEFVLDKYAGFKGYNGNKTVSQLHPEWNKEMKSITNVGNYWGNTNVGYGIADLIRSGHLPRFYGRGRSVGYGGNWLDICSKTKQAFAAARQGQSSPYDQRSFFNINVNGMNIHTRADCSGYVSACISAYVGKQYLTSSAGLGRNCSMLKENGFVALSWPGWEGLQAGDILVNPGSHTEIFAGQPDKVWNAGANNSISTPGTTTKSYSSYSVVWRCTNPGFVTANLVSENTSISESQVNNTSRKTDPFSKLLSSMGSTISSSLPGLKGGSLDNPDIGFGVGNYNTPKDFFESTLGGKLTSGYGNRSSVLGDEYHRGMDFSAPYGQNIYSPVDGQIVDVGTDVAGYGNYAVLKDTSGNNHIFAHMAKPIGYGIGTNISKNDIIGQVGNSGNAIGSHLHYEIRKNGNKYSAFNPTGFKYDKGLGKSLNIHSVNSKLSNTEDGMGSGNRDFTSEVKDKLDIALNTTNIEEKMDSIISVLGTMAEGIGGMAKAPATSSITNNTTVYGPGRSPSTTVIRSNREKIKKDDTMTLAKYHKIIASKK